MCCVSLTATSWSGCRLVSSSSAAYSLESCKLPAWTMSLQALLSCATCATFCTCNAQCHAGILSEMQNQFVVQVPGLPWHMPLRNDALLPNMMTRRVKRCNKKTMSARRHNLKSADPSRQSPVGSRQRTASCMLPIGGRRELLHGRRRVRGHAWNLLPQL